MTTSVDSICKKTAPSNDGEPVRAPEAVPFDPAKHVSPTIAHELNNILAIVQGYADRLLLQYADNTTLTSDLKLITEAARRAAIIIRNATPQILAQPVRHASGEHEPEPSIA